MQTITHTLTREIEAARLLLQTYADILHDDDEAKADAIEGETDLIEAIRAGIIRLAEIEVLMEGASALKKTLSARIERLDAQYETIRTALAIAMEVAEKKRLETDIGTITLKKVAPSVRIIEEADIPPEFWKPQAPKLDKKSVLDALKAKRDVLGAELSNGGVTVQVSRR